MQPVTPVSLDPVRMSATWAVARPTPLPPRVTRAPQGQAGERARDFDDRRQPGDRQPGRPSTEEAIAQATPWWFDARLRRDQRRANDGARHAPARADDDDSTQTTEQVEVDRRFEGIVRADRTRRLPWVRGELPPASRGAKDL
jgi:hypothetical protein